MVLLFCSDWVLFKRCPSPHRFTLEQTHIPTLQICFHTDAAYKQCNSVVMRLFGFSLQVCGALFPHVWQDGDLFLHCCLLRPVVNKLTNCKCSIYPWRVCVYSVCSYLFLSVCAFIRLNLRELGPWACHMRWLVWVMASFGTTYVFFFHERSVQTSIVLKREHNLSSKVN